MCECVRMCARVSVRVCVSVGGVHCAGEGMRMCGSVCACACECARVRECGRSSLRR